METMIVAVIILLLNIQGTAATECSDAAESHNISYIRMCEDGSVTSDKVILDTHDAGATGETTCSCTVNATLIFSVYVQHFGNGLNPNTSGCGSEVRFNDVADDVKRSFPFTCNEFQASVLHTPPVNITWSGGPGEDSNYCLNITGLLILPNTTFTIDCFKPKTTTTPPSTPASTTTAAGTTTQPTTPSEVSSSTTSVPNTDQGTASGSPTTSQPTSTVPTDTSTQTTEDSLPLIIVIPAAAGGFLLIVIIVIIAVVCSRKHGKSSKGRESYIDDTIGAIDPYGTSNPGYSGTGDNSGEERDGMKRNILYDTSHQILLPNGNYSTVQLPQSNSPEVEYSQVKKNPSKQQNEEGEQNKFELSDLDGAGNDTYAVVNKPKKNKQPDDESTNASYKTDEGLVYVKVDTTRFDNSVRKSNTPDDRKDAEKTDTDHVAYAQVVVT